jgi:hypothetical protein
MFTYLFGLPFSQRQRRLARNRPAMTKTRFVENIVSTGGDAAAAAFVWDRIISFCIEPGHSPYPDDSLAQIYGIAEEDRDEDIILKILEKAKLPIPDSKTIELFGEVDTPRRVAQFVEFCRAQNPKPS